MGPAIRRPLAAVAALCLAVSAVVVGAASARAADSYDPACDGASEASGAFADGGLAADCLKMYGIALGKNDGTFGEDDLLIRSQVSSLLARFVNLAGVGMDQHRSFPDTDNMSNTQVRDEIERLAGAGIIAGYPDGLFHPNDPLSVAQAATLIVRTFQYIHAAKPQGPNAQDQGSTQANYDAAKNAGLINPSATDISGSQYASGAGDQTARGLLADVLAVSVQVLVDYGITNSRSPFIWFRDGQYHVGSQIPAGTYRAPNTAQGCYWERESGFSGSFNDVIANDIRDGGPEIVTIDPSDAGFKSDRCGYWSNDLKALKSPSDPIPSGMWQVNLEVAPGTYSASPAESGGSCYFERLSGFSGTFNDILGNGISSSSQIVTISGSDVGFATSGCTPWMPSP